MADICSSLHSSGIVDFCMTRSRSKTTILLSAIGRLVFRLGTGTVGTDAFANMSSKVAAVAPLFPGSKAGNADSAIRCMVESMTDNVWAMIITNPGEQSRALLEAFGGK